MSDKSDLIITCNAFSLLLFLIFTGKLLFSINLLNSLILPEYNFEKKSLIKSLEFMYIYIIRFY